MPKRAIIGALVVLSGASCSLVWPYDKLESGAPGSITGGDARSDVTLIDGRPTWKPCANVGWCRLGDDTILARQAPPKTAAYDYPARLPSTLAYASAVADVDNDVMVLWAGGYEYGGNEVYTLRLGDAPRLERRNDPSPYSECQPTAPDGAPAARVTRSSLTFIPANAARSPGGPLLFSLAGEIFCPNKSTPMDDATWLLDLGAITDPGWKPKWTRKTPPLPADPDYLGLVADFDPGSNKVIVHLANALWTYDPAADAYAKVLDDYIHYSMHAIAVPTRDMFIVLGCDGCDTVDNERTGLKVYRRRAAGDWTAERRTDEARATCKPLLDASAPGLAYDPVLDRVVGWPNQGSTVYLLDLDTFTCKAQTFAGGPAEEKDTKTQTRGRFRYFPHLGAFVLLPLAEQPAWALRLPGVEK